MFVIDWMLANWVALIGILLGAINLLLNFINRARSDRQEAIVRISDRNEALKVATAHRNVLRQIHADLLELHRKAPDVVTSDAVRHFADEAQKVQEQLKRLTEHLPADHAEHAAINRLKGEMEASAATYTLMLENLKQAAASVKKPIDPFDPSTARLNAFR